MWHVSSRSGVATLRNAIHVLLTYMCIRNTVAERFYSANGERVCLSVRTQISRTKRSVFSRFSVNVHYGRISAVVSRYVA